MEYDLKKLNDREFEELSASIIGKILKTRIETFKSGKDRGVDGRFWIGNSKEGIIQCKHYINTPFSTLIKKLETEEVKKVKALNPKRYIFMTSSRLSRENKEKIKKIFNPFITREDDIYGYEDLSRFLTDKHNIDIVEQNFKLWITSTSVFDLIYNNAIKGRSESTINEIKENSHKYVITTNHEKGLNILEKKNVLILTGEPGIGKTTLASNLVLYYSAKGYEFYDIEENISEAENIYREKENKKIIFYCDDFLGSNIYDAISNKKDSHIVKFIKRVSKDNTKKFILTSRTNILNKAFSLSHSFQNGKIRDNEFMLKIENISNIEKAKILYNHIYHSKLSEDYIDKIYEEKNYRQIIKHRNFNPRIVEFLTDDIKVGKISSIKYWNYIISCLDNPEDIWADFFQNQTDDCNRALTFLTVYNNGQISEDTLRDSYYNFIKYQPLSVWDNTDKSFEAVKKLAIKSLLNRNQISSNSFEYVLFNPSISDFVLNSYSNECEMITNIFKSLGTQSSIKLFKSLVFSKKISEKHSKIIQENLFNYFIDIKIKEKDWDFLILLTYVDVFNENLYHKIEHFLKHLIDDDTPVGNNLYELLIILENFNSRIEIKTYKFLNNFIENTFDEDTLKTLVKFINNFNINEFSILNIVKIQIEDYLSTIANNSDLDIDFEKHIQFYIHQEGFHDYEIDVNGIESDVIKSLESYLKGFDERGLDKFNLNIQCILDDLNYVSMAEDYLEIQMSENNIDEYKEIYYNNSNNNDDFDFIFERS